MTPEGNVKKRVKEMLHELDILPFKQALAAVRSGKKIHGYYQMPSASGYGEAGIGDFLLSICGHYMEIETKTKDGDQRGIQKLHQEVVDASNGSYIIIKQEEDMLRLKSALTHSYANWKSVCKVEQARENYLRSLH